MEDPNKGECIMHDCDGETDGDRLLCSHHYTMGSGETDRTPMPDGRHEAYERLEAYWRGDYEYPSQDESEIEV